MTPLLEVDDLAVRFELGRGRTVRAVDGVSFTVGAAEAVALVGESGSGKTTIARAVVGLERPSAGSIRLGGEPLAARAGERTLAPRRRIQFVFQDPSAALDPRHTVGRIVAEPLAIHRVCTRAARRERAAALLAEVGLAPEHLARYPHELSGGQRQRVGIARALALEPELLVLDEPLSALDVSVQAQVGNLLCDLRERRGLALLLIAHDLAVVRALCERALVLHLGRVVEEGPREALFADPRHPYTRALLSAAPVPDPAVERTRARIVLRGEPPSPLDPPTGCRFHPRCPERERVPDRICERIDPPLVRCGPGRVACHAVAATETASKDLARS